MAPPRWRRWGGGCGAGRGLSHQDGSSRLYDGPNQGAAQEPPLLQTDPPSPCAHRAQVATKPLMSIPSKAGAKRSHASVAQSLIGSAPARLLLRLHRARLAAPGGSARHS